MPEERAFLTESLAKYAELVMIERRYGRKAMRALVEYERERYRQERIDPERPVLPLIDADDGPDMYSRATLVFACLRARVGDDRIVQALRQSIDAQASDTPTRSIDFVRQLSALAPQMRAVPSLVFCLRRTHWSVQCLNLDVGYSISEPPLSPFFSECRCAILSVVSVSEEPRVWLERVRRRRGVCAIPPYTAGPKL